MRSLLPVLVILSAAVLHIGRSSEPGASLEPKTAVAGEFGTWTVRVTLGDHGLQPNGAIRVQMPDEWHSGPRNSATPLQATDPSKDHYVTARCSREGVTLETVVEHQRDVELVKHAKPSLDGRYERYVMVVRVSVTRGELRASDTIDIVYGDTSGGSRGYRAGDVLLDLAPVLIDVDAEGEGAFKRIEPAPQIEIVPGPVAELQFHAPSQGQVGRPIRVRLAALDAEHNPVREALKVDVQVEAGEAKAPATIEIPEDVGHAYFEVTPLSSGVLRLTAEVKDGALTARANPIDVTDEAPERLVYWGDLHSHTHHSWDGVGSNAFEYARDVSGLDFYAMTDHSLPVEKQGTRGLHPGVWDDYTAETEAHHEPGRFVTLHAYECSFGRPYGHHNVFFRGAPGALRNPHEVTLPELWEVLEAGDALTIPHHTGKFPSGIDFSVHDAELRRNFEIYSGHGLSEAYDPDHPLAFEQSLFTSDARSLDEPTHAQDVWIQGLQLSTVAASDDHRAKPGQPQYGLTAVYVPELTRDSIFQGLYDRATYGTTGAKILLDVRLNGAPMGSQVEVEGEPRIRVRAIGTDTIAEVEILRWRPGEEQFVVCHEWLPNTEILEDRWTDPDHRPGTIYYVRLRQANKVRGRAVMAWSSPIWTHGGAGED